MPPAVAASIVSDFCRQIVNGDIHGVPSRHVIRITEDGRVLAEGPIGAGRATVARAATLLDDLLASHATGSRRTPGGLRLVVARALGTLDLPPYAGLQELCGALARFGTPDLRSALLEIYGAWAALERHPLPVRAGTVLPSGIPRVQTTISDVRRARRATGLTLGDVAERSRVPEPLLRELEWGYLRNWPAGQYGRAQLVRYARAAGLDERIVVEAAWPLLEEVVLTRGRQAVVPQPAEQPIDALVPLKEATDEPAGVITLRPLPFPAQPAPRRHRWVAPLAVAAALVLAVVPIVHERRAQPSIGAPVSATAAQHDTAGDVIARHVQRIAERVVPAGATRTIPDGAAYAPSFSNVGTAVFYSSERPGETAVVRAAAGEQGALLRITRIVDDHARNYHARPSPDGSLIAFDSDREGLRAVFVADASGRHVRRVSGDGFAAVPSWSPDGRQIALAKAEPGQPRVWNLWSVDLATGQLTRLTDYSSGQPWGGSWFPDGRRIAYSHEDQVVVLDIASGRRRVFTAPLKGHLVRTLAVAPDGRRIIFQVARDGGWLLDVVSGRMRRVLDDASAEGYTWSPDGHRVAFHSDRTGGWGVRVLGEP